MSVEPKSDATARAEIASLDRIRRSPKLRNGVKPWGVIEFRRAATSRKFAVFCALIKNSRFVITAHTSVTFRTNDLRKSIPIVRAPRQGDKRRAVVTT